MKEGIGCTGEDFLKWIFGWLDRLRLADLETFRLSDRLRLADF